MKDLAELSLFFVHQSDNHSRAVGPGMSSRSRRSKHPLLQLTTALLHPPYIAAQSSWRPYRQEIDRPATLSTPCSKGVTPLRLQRNRRASSVEHPFADADRRNQRGLCQISCCKCQACLEHVPVEDMPGGPNVLDRYTSPAQRLPALAVTLASERSLAESGGCLLSTTYAIAALNLDEKPAVVEVTRMLEKSAEKIRSQRRERQGINRK